jgi:ferric-dicitrate binding protein FerR (iron transport regulator)
VCSIAIAALFSYASPLSARTPNPKKQTQSPQAVGSLSSAGSVLVNDSPAPADVTIFSGDTVRTNDGTAAFSLSGKGSFKLAPNSEMSFQPDPRYSGELRSGIVMMNSFGGATDISLRAGNYVIAPVIQAQQSASKIERHSDGSFTISCLDGSVGLIPLEGTTGRVLQSGESANILASGQLDQPQSQAPPAPTPVEETPAAAATKPVDQTPAPVPAKGNSKKNEYILLGLAGVAAVGAAAALAGSGHGSSSVSPSSP